MRIGRPAAASPYTAAREDQGELPFRDSFPRRQRQRLHGGKKSCALSFRLGRSRPALAHIPADEASFPVSSWQSDLLETGVRKVVPNSQIIRQPSPPGLGLESQTNGSNLPWVPLPRAGNRTTAFSLSLPERCFEINRTWIKKACNSPEASPAHPTLGKA